MIEVRCPQCDLLIEAPAPLAGKIVGCPQCNADVAVPVPASAQVIEVHAESVDDDEVEVEAVRYEEDPFFNPEAQHPAGNDQVWGRTIRVEQMGNGGGGCCASGCALIAVAVFFLFYGIVSFFS